MSRRPAGSRRHDGSRWQNRPCRRPISSQRGRAAWAVLATAAGGALVYVLLAGAVTAAGSGPTVGGPGRPIAAVTEAEIVMQLTGKDSPNRTDVVDVYGTDLGIIADAGDRLYIAFGDTFGKGRPASGPGGSNWRSNVMAYTTDVDPSDGIRLDGWITGEEGKAREIVAGNKDPNDAGGEVTKIPTAMVAAGSRLYLHFMSVRHWGPPGRWDANFSAWAYSDDQGRSWAVTPAMWKGDSSFIELAVSLQPGRGNEDGWLVILGTPAGRFGPVRLARVRPDRILEPQAYQYYAGLDADRVPIWQADERLAAPVIPAPVGEASLVWIPDIGRWIFAYLNEYSHNLELRDSPTPWGPWSNPHTVARAVRYPALYGAFTTPRWIRSGPGGIDLYFLMSRFPPYNVLLMRAVLQVAQ